MLCLFCDLPEAAHLSPSRSFLGACGKYRPEKEGPEVCGTTHGFDGWTCTFEKGHDTPCGLVPLDRLERSSNPDAAIAKFNRYWEKMQYADPVPSPPEPGSRCRACDWDGYGDDPRTTAHTPGNFVSLLCPGPELAALWRVREAADAFLIALTICPFNRAALKAARHELNAALAATEGYKR